MNKNVLDFFPWNCCLRTLLLVRNFAVFAVQFWVDKNITFVVQFASSTVCSQNYRVFPFFFSSFFKAFWQVTNYFWSCSIFFFLWCHLSFFMMNWKDYKLNKYTIIGKCKCMLYQINKLWWLFFNSRLRTLRS